MTYYTWQQVSDTGGLFSAARGLFTSRLQAMDWLNVTQEDETILGMDIFLDREGNRYMLTLIIGQGV